MSDTSTPTSGRSGPSDTETAPRPRSAPTALVVLLQSLVLLALLAGAAAAAGLVWARWWDAPEGVVRSGRWLTDETGLRAAFAGVGLYVVCALAAGAICALLAALLLSRSPLVTLAVLLLGAAAAGVLMRQVGLAQSPPNPQLLARTLPEDTRLPGRLTLPGLAPLVAMPLGALLAYALTSLVLPEHGSRPSPEDPSGPGFPTPPAG